MPLLKNALTRLVIDGDKLVLVPQVLVELWVVATRPLEANGFGWDANRVSSVIGILRTQFELLDEIPSAFELWLKLVRENNILGKRAHDARLAAMAIAHGVFHILTLNTDDFVGLPEITPLHPLSVISV